MVLKSIYPVPQRVPANGRISLINIQNSGRIVQVTVRIDGQSSEAAKGCFMINYDQGNLVQYPSPYALLEAQGENLAGASRSQVHKMNGSWNNHFQYYVLGALLISYS